MSHPSWDELDEELLFHLDHLVAQKQSRGLTLDEARRQALIEMGGMARRREEMRDTRPLSFFEHLGRDLRYALRSLRRAPGYTLVALVTLALGLGANTAIFTVVNTVLLRPLAYDRPQELVAVDGTVAPATYIDWHAQLHALAATGAAEWWSPTITGHGDPEQIDALHVSASLFPLLGVAPAMGRVPTADEEHAGGHRVLVLGDRAWRRRFAADPQILGKQLVLDGEPYEIIGVMPPSFRFAPYWATRAEMWSPLVLDARTTDRRGASMRVFGRLAPGRDVTAAQAELVSLNSRLEREFPGSTGDYHVRALREMVVGDVRPALLALLGAVGLVLLIACANVAHLQLLRAAARSRETAVRAALGASRIRLVQQSLVESSVLALGGGALGALVAWAGVRALVLLGPPHLPQLDALRLDARVFAFLLVASLVSCIGFGIVPAFRGADADTSEALKEGGRGTSEGRGRRKLRGVLVTSEFATALVLLVGAGLLIRSFMALASVKPGFDPHHALGFQVSLKGTAHADTARRRLFFTELEQRLRTMPGVVAAGATNHLPIMGDNWNFSYSAEGQPYLRQDERHRALFRIARPGYFGAMGIPVKRGRDFTDQDGAASARVVIVNEVLAAREWPGQDPVGRRISVADPNEGAEWFMVVGVTGTVVQGALREAPIAEMYYPNERPAAGDSSMLVGLLNPSEMQVVVRTRGDAAALVKPVTDAVHAIDRDAAVALAMPLDDLLATEFKEPTFYLLLIGSFAAIAVILAAVGVYGVISYSAARRTHEMGVRLALGAAASEPFRLVAGEGMRLALVGGAIGLGLSVLLTRYLRTLLYGVAPTDPLMFAVAPGVLLLIALLACWIPARRAARIDPITALRSE